MKVANGIATATRKGNDVVEAQLLSRVTFNAAPTIALPHFTLNSAGYCFTTSRLLFHRWHARYIDWHGRLRLSGLQLDYGERHGVTECLNEGNCVFQLRLCFNR